MQLQHTPPLHLTYCLNVHPAETWSETRHAIAVDAADVRRRVCPEQPFGLGLRISNAASLELTQPPALDDLQNLLASQKCYAFTVNGFPFGRFHNAAVKADVYAPDWRSDARREYTCRLADILAAILPEGMAGSISTVPVGYARRLNTPAAADAAAEQLAKTAEHLQRIHAETGRHITLALEPEPDCTAGTTDEVIAFFENSLLPGREQAALRQHIGVCVDTAHCAVEFENPADAIDRLGRAGLTTAKVQLSAALEADATPDALQRLEAFAEGVYLHQVRVRTSDGRLLRFADLPLALANQDARRPENLWRVHFHVPLFWPGDATLRSTRSLLDAHLATLLRASCCSHAEIETYTFGVLPPGLWNGDLAAGVAEEFAWTRRWLMQGDPPGENYRES
jgi:sugar phosphate isomerase/epimerase